MAAAGSLEFRSLGAAAKNSREFFPRLSDAEFATLNRLEAHPSLSGLAFRQSEHVGAEVVDDLGRTYDFVGQPAASLHWNADEFFASIEGHLRKSNDFTVVDVSGFAREHLDEVKRFVDALPPVLQQQIVRIGF